MSLIPSHRHSDADLAHWESISEYDRRLAAADYTERLEAAAIEAIQEFTADQPATVGVTWGKDSVVLAHLAWRAGVDVPYIQMLRDKRPDRINNPDSPLVAQAFLSRFPIPYSEYLSDADDGLAEMNKAYCDGRYISGVRAGESSSRVLAMRRHGIATERTCRPLGYWDSTHIWAYLTKYDLPIHPAYAMTLGGRLDRSRIRVHGFGNLRGDGFGRIKWERHYYPEVWNALDKAAAESH